VQSFTPWWERGEDISHFRNGENPLQERRETSPRLGGGGMLPVCGILAVYWLCSAEQEAFLPASALLYAVAPSLFQVHHPPLLSRSPSSFTCQPPRVESLLVR